MIETILRIVTILLSILVTLVVILQVKGTGAGFFGSTYGTFRTRRGFERVLFRATIVLVVLFIAVAVTAVTYRSRWAG